MQRIILTEEDCQCYILDFYKNVAEKAGIEIKKNTCFDCRKICVTPSVCEALLDYYVGNDISEYSFSTFWLLYGPKANLEEDKKALYVAEIEDSFCYEKEEEEK